MGIEDKIQWIHVFVGLGFIGLGFLLKAFPNLIAGYNIMSREEKDTIDINGFSTALRNLLIIWGVIFAVGYNLLILLGFEYIAGYIPIIFVITLIICMFLFQIIYTVKKKKE